MSTREKRTETTVISLRLTPEELAYLRALAKRRKLSVSETIRQAILTK